MKLFITLSSIFLISISVYFSTPLQELLTSLTNSRSITITTTTIPQSITTQESMTTANAIKSTMSKALYNDYDPKVQNFGSLRVLNEDRVDPHRGFDTHPHRDAEIFSYILNGELTHRDSMIKKGKETEEGDDFYRMKRGDVQFTTGGTGMVSTSLLIL
jgi:redox-sensitive bicupin YhaK (pirin superfamily)